MGIGFTSRGCIRKCSFCVVPEKEGSFHQVSDLKNIVRPGSDVICLLDSNLTADPDCIEKLNEIKDRGLILDLTQGIDIRLVNEEIALALSEVRHLRSIHYAWDLMAHEKSVMKGIKTLKRYIKPWKHMCFMLVGYNTSFEEDMYRFKKLTEEKVDPYVMIYNKIDDTKLKHFARWVNGRIYKKCSFSDYRPWAKIKA